MSRPMIQRNNELPRPMTDNEYKQFLQDQQNIPVLPESPEQRLDRIEPQVEANTLSVDDLTCALADIYGGGLV